MYLFSRPFFSLSSFVYIFIRKGTNTKTLFPVFFIHYLLFFFTFNENSNSRMYVCTSTTREAKRKISSFYNISV